MIKKDSILETLISDKTLSIDCKSIDKNCPMIQGENTVIVGRTGKGKTMLGINFVNQILKNNPKIKIIVFSLELKKKCFFQKLLAANYNIENYKIKNNNFSEKEKKDYIKYAEDYINLYSNRLLIIDDMYSIEEIEKFLKNLEKDHVYFPNYILIDYVNILSFKGLSDINKHIQISTWIKYFSKKNNIHIQAICQANRSTKDNHNEYPKTENLADSDQYGRDAFIVYSIKTDMNKNKYYINPTKNRNGKSEEEIFLRSNPKSGTIFLEENKKKLIHRF